MEMTSSTVWKSFRAGHCVNVTVVLYLSVFDLCNVHTVLQFILPQRLHFSSQTVYLKDSFGPFRYHFYCLSYSILPKMQENFVTVGLLERRISTDS